MPRSLFPLLLVLVLWNDINVSNEGVRSFKLVFEDANGGALRNTGTYTVVSQLAPQT